MVVFTDNLAVFIPAVLKSPWSKLFGIVIKFDRLLITFPVPVLMGDGNFLYPLAIGSKIALSKPWLNAKVALFKPSKQSLTCPFELIVKSLLPSVPALALNGKPNIIITI